MPFQLYREVNMSHYIILGTMVIERKEDGESHELLNFNFTSSHHFLEMHGIEDDIHAEYWKVIDEIPKEPGLYSYSCVLRMTPYYDAYNGEHDVDVDCEWSYVRKYDDDEAKCYLECEGLTETESENGSREDRKQDESTAEGPQIQWSDSKALPL